MQIHIRVDISLADIEIQFLDCYQLRGKLSTNIAMEPDPFGEFAAIIAKVFTLYSLLKTTSSKNVVFMFFKDLKLVFISLKIG